MENRDWEQYLNRGKEMALFVCNCHQLTEVEPLQNLNHVYSNFLFDYFNLE